MKTNYLFALLAVLAGGCAVGPNYHTPQAAATAHWSEPLAGGEDHSALAVTAWWKNFNDPELDSLIEHATRSNLDVRIAQARVREARALAGIAAADFLPTIDASGSYTRQRQSQHQPVLGSIPLPSNVPFENNVYQAGFDSSWELDVFGGTRRSVESAKAEVAASEYGRRDTLVTLLSDVARNYIEARGYQRRLAIANENIKAQTDALNITHNRFTNGLTSDLDVQQAATLLATTRAEIPALEAPLQASIHRLGVLLGQQPGALLTELSQPQAIPATPSVVPVGLPSDLLQRRPDVQRAERQLAAATANIGVAKADLYPKFFLTGAAGFESVSASDWFTGGSKFWSAGPTVQWKIFDGGRVRANIKVQDARQEQALANYEKTMLTSFEEVENALVAYAREQVRHQTLAEAVATSQDTLHLANQLYGNGLADFLNVLDAERSLYQAQDALVQSERNVSVDLVALYKALGGGWENVPQQTALASAAPVK